MSRLVDFLLAGACFAAAWLLWKQERPDAERDRLRRLVAAFEAELDRQGMPRSGP